MQPKGTSRGDGRSTICTCTLTRRLVQVVAGQPPRRHVVGFDVIDVHRKRSHVEFWGDSSVSYRLCGLVMYMLLFWARTWDAIPD